jgi:hypothetical protein
LNVRIFSLTGSLDLGDFETTVTSTLKKDGQTGVWFPSEVVNDSFLKGSTDGPLKGQTKWGSERIRILRAKLNVPINPERFSREAMFARIIVANDDGE